MQEQYSNYVDDQQQMWKCSNHAQKKCEYFKANYGTLGLDKVNSCISIGAGQGDVDSFLVRECMPSLKQYYGEEPYEGFRSMLINAMNDPRIKDVEVKIFSEPAETWEGPGVKVDAVFVIQSIFYIQERSKFLAKCLEWLSPGGLLMVVTHTADSFIPVMARAFDAKAPLAVNHETARRDLEEIGITKIKEYYFPMESYIEHGNNHFVAHVLGREVTNEEVEAFYNYRKKMFTGCKIITKNAIFLWTKP